MTIRANIKILYLVTEDWYFWSHRLPLARAVSDLGWSVIIATRVQKHGEQIQAEGFHPLPIRLRRRIGAPWSEAAAIIELVKILRRERPDIIHNIALKPAIYGSLAAWLTSVPTVISTVAGLGFVFSSSRLRARLLRPFLKLAMRALVVRRDNQIIVQNSEDFESLAKFTPRSQLSLIRGSGVNLHRFAPTLEPEGPPVATLVSRMLVDKGVYEIVTAARILRRRNVPIKIWLVGAPDPENPASIQESQLRSWHNLGLVKWWGPLEDIPRVWSESHIAVLPSHREGLPKSLLEAASCGRPIVATDVPGCREIVRPHETGLLVPPKKPEALADALEIMAKNPALRRRLGAGARKLVEAAFAEDRIIEETLTLYHNALARREKSVTQQAGS